MATRSSSTWRGNDSDLSFSTVTSTGYRNDLRLNLPSCLPNGVARDRAAGPWLPQASRVQQYPVPNPAQERDVRVPDEQDIGREGFDLPDPLL